MVLSAAIAIQSFNSHPDPWLIAALGLMVISKIVALGWKQRSE